MSPRRLDRAVIGTRLQEIRLLLDDLAAVGQVDAAFLRRDRPTRHIVERVLSQIVELAGSTNTHIVAAVLGRAPDSYAASFDEVSRAGVLAEDFAASLRPSAGLRNALVHDYIEIDHEKVAAAVPMAIRLYEQYVLQVARWLRDLADDEPEAGG